MTCAKIDHRPQDRQVRWIHLKGRVEFRRRLVKFPDSLMAPGQRQGLYIRGQLCPGFLDHLLRPLLTADSHQKPHTGNPRFFELIGAGERQRLFEILLRLLLVRASRCCVHLTQPHKIERIPGILVDRLVGQVDRALIVAVPDEQGSLGPAQIGRQIALLVRLLENAFHFGDALLIVQKLAIAAECVGISVAQSQGLLIMVKSELRIPFQLVQGGESPVSGAERIAPVDDLHEQSACLPGAAFVASGPDAVHDRVGPGQAPVSAVAVEFLDFFGQPLQCGGVVVAQGKVEQSKANLQIARHFVRHAAPQAFGLQQLAGARVNLAQAAQQRCLVLGAEVGRVLFQLA